MEICYLVYTVESAALKFHKQCTWKVHSRLLVHGNVNEREYHLVHPKVHK